MADLNAIAKAAAGEISKLSMCTTTTVAHIISRAISSYHDEQVSALVEALKEWERLDSESSDKHPCPDLTLRVLYRDRARKLTPAALAPYREKTDG